MGEALTPMPPNNSADQVAEIRRLNAWNLRAQGKSYREIGAELGVSHVTAWKDVEAFHEAEANSIREEAKHHIAMALQRNDRVIAVLQPLAESGDLEAADRLDKFEKRRAALIGMDAPDRKEITGKDGERLNGPVIYVPAESDD